MLREELQLLQEQGSYVGEVIKPMDKKKGEDVTRRTSIITGTRILCRRSYQANGQKESFSQNPSRRQIYCRY